MKERQWATIHLVCEQGVRMKGLLERNASHKQRDRGDDRSVCALKHHMPGFCTHASRLQDVTETHPSPLRVADCASLPLDPRYFGR